MAISEGCGLTKLFGKRRNYGRKNAEKLHDITITHPILPIMYSRLSQRAMKNSSLSQMKYLVSETQQEMHVNQN